MPRDFPSSPTPRQGKHIQTMDFHVSERKHRSFRPRFFPLDCAFAQIMNITNGCSLDKGRLWRGYYRNKLTCGDGDSTPTSPHQELLCLSFLCLPKKPSLYLSDLAFPFIFPYSPPVSQPSLSPFSASRADSRISSIAPGP